MSKRATEAVAAEVRAEMGRQDVNGAQLAQRLGVSEMWVSRRIRGITPLTVSELADVAKALAVPIAKFLPEPERAA